MTTIPSNPTASWLWWKFRKTVCTKNVAGPRTLRCEWSNLRREILSSHSVCTLADLSCGFWHVGSCFQLYWNLWHPYCYFCNYWWKRCSLYKAASVFSFISSRHWKLCERHWRSEVLRLKKPVRCPNKIQGQGQYSGTVQNFCQKLRDCLLPFWFGQITRSPLVLWARLTTPLLLQT